MKKSFKLVSSLCAALLAVGAGVALSGANQSGEVKADVVTQRIFIDMTYYTDYYGYGASFKLQTWDNSTGDVYHDAVKASDCVWYVDLDSAASGYRFWRYNGDGTEQWGQGLWTSDLTKNVYHPTGMGTDEGQWVSYSVSIKAKSTSWGTYAALTEPSSDNSKFQFVEKGLEFEAGDEFKPVVTVNGTDSWLSYSESSIDSKAKAFLSSAEGENPNIIVDDDCSLDIYVNPNEKTYWIQVSADQEALSFSESFLAATSTICSDPNRDNKTALEAIWPDQKNAFEAMTIGAKAVFNGSEDATISQARSLYQHCVARYNLTAWTGAVEVSSSASLSLFGNVSDSANMVMIIVVISLVSLTAVGGFFFYRKRRHN